MRIEIYMSKDETKFRSAEWWKTPLVKEKIGVINDMS